VRALDDRQVLDVWARGEPLHAVDRTLALLAAGRADAAPDELAAISLGERNALVLELRERTFGTRLDAHAACPRCAAALELATTTTALRAAAAPALADPDDLDAGLALDADGYAIALRRLDSFDLAAIAGLTDRDAARRELVARAVTAVELDGAAVDPRALPDAVVAAIGRRLGELEPLLDVQLELACPGCAHAFAAPFDPGAYLWREVAVRARRLVRDVDRLARAYGWTEAEVIALPPVRRRAYLELIGDA
jgi:hypothetical protein